jgi:trimeric autotransporter adhesin
VALLAVLCLVSGGVWVAVALAANPVPSPTITSQPANPTSQTSASFSYTESNAVTLTRFECSLDSTTTYVACGTSRPSSKSYSGLGAGSHTFRVRAVSSSPSGTSDPTAYTWTIDTTAPTVSSMNRADASPTNAASVHWTVKFSEPVTGVAANGSNFSLVTSGFSGSPSVTAVTGSGDTYTVTASTDGATTTNSASEALRLSSAGSIKDLAGNAITGLPVTGQAYAVDKLAPTVVSINRADPSPTNASSVHWTVTFSESVTGVGTSNFSLTSSGFASAPSVTGVSGSGATYTVTADTDGATTTNSASEALRLSTAAPITDLAGNGLSGVPVTGQAYAVDKLVPTVVSINRADASPTKANPLHWTVTFSEPVKNVGSGNFGLVLSGIGGTTPTVTSATPSGSAPASVWTVTVSTAGATGANGGSIELDLTAKGTIQDAVGNGLGGSVPVPGLAYAFDTTPPAVTVTFPSNGGTYTSTAWNAGCAGGPGICGSATDPSGVSGAAVSIQQQSSGKWWNGSSFASSSETFNLVTQVSGSGTTFSGRYPLAAPPAGSYLVHVRASDNLGNVHTSANQISLTFTIGGAVLPYTIGANPIATLYPGVPASAASKIDVTFNNPNSDTVKVTTLTVTVTSVTGGTGVPRSCTPSDYAVTNYTGSPFYIPVGSSSLSTISPAISQSSWPTIRMLDNGNQDGCRGATVHLSFSGNS